MSRIVAESLYLTRWVRTEVRQIFRGNFNASIMQLVQSMRQIVYRLSGHSVGHEFIVDNRLFFVGRIVCLQTTLVTKIQEFRELVVTLNLCRTLVNGVARILVPGPAQQESRAYSMAQLLKCTGERVPASPTALSDRTRERDSARPTALHASRELGFNLEGIMSRLCPPFEKGK